MAKQRAIIIDEAGDRHGPLFRLGRTGSRYFIDKIAPAGSPNAGKVKRSYAPSKAAAKKGFLDACDYHGL